MSRSRSAVIDEERRDLSLADSRVEIRGDGDDDKRFVGHASVTNTRTSIGNPMKWGFYEEIRTGAFTKTLGECDARFLWDHDSAYVISRMTAGTLSLREDNVGLGVDSALDTELSYVRDLMANIRNKNVTGMSFGFYVVKDSWTEEEIEVAGLDDPVTVEVRSILEVRLVEVSAVTFPAYPETDAGLRAVAMALRGRGDDEAIQRRLGLKPELATILGVDPKRSVVVGGVDLGDKVDTDTPEEIEREVVSTVEEPGESTPQQTDTSDTEPGETTRDDDHAPSDEDIRRVRLAQLQARLRRPAA